MIDYSGFLWRMQVSGRAASPFRNVAARDDSSECAISDFQPRHRWHSTLGGSEVRGLICGHFRELKACLGFTGIREIEFVGRWG